MTKCEPGKYKSIENECKKCDESCKTCLDFKKCIECKDGYFLNDKSECLNDCGVKYYKDQDTKFC